MALANTRALTRRPTHPGEMLREDFLPDYELTVAGLAEAAGVSRQSVNELLRGRRAVSPEMALRLGRLFGDRHSSQCRSIIPWRRRASVSADRTHCGSATDRARSVLLSTTRRG
jgi:addiction module HigA family antidote